jgi:MFS family permease
MCAFLGPVAGPIVGGFCVQELALNIGWRWAFWTQLILSGVLGTGWFVIPETFHKTLLAQKRKRLQLAAPESTQPAHAAQDKFRTAMFRPLEMLARDPIVFFSSLYIAFIFGILYLFFAAYPVVFIGRYHMKPGTSSLAFLGIAVGVILSFFTAGIANQLYLKLKKQRGLEATTFPEGRLPLSIGAAWLVPVSLFWFGWSGRAGVHWIVPILSGLP